MRPFLPLAIALCAALPLHAETWKWVDAKGVTNYSSSPPEAKGAKAQLVEERLSIVPADPDLDKAAAALRAREARRAASADAEWLQRQRLMAAQSAYPAPQCPDGSDCGRHGARVTYPDYYYAPVVVVRRAPHTFPHNVPVMRRHAQTGRWRNPQR